MILTNRTTDEDVGCPSMIRKRLYRSNTVPDFEYDAYYLGQSSSLRLSDVFHQQYKSVVLFFYETDSAPHHQDIDQVREHYQDFMDKNALPMMISINDSIPHQDPSTHLPLVGDSNQAIAKHFHEPGNACRSVFVIDSHYKIKYSFMPLEADQPYSIPVILSIAGGLMNQD
ncbi:hypothetical protein BC941DRAFT_4984 [Chlamydoabsidia padenii]|nr:hypothetical protein BC941DRAFT_4984 [Chlamydoabsidia padenii]